MKRIGGSHQFRGYFYLHSRTSDFGGLIEIDMLKPSRRRGPVAQWITRLTTDQKILGSTPGWLVIFSCLRLVRAGAGVGEGKKEILGLFSPLFSHSAS